MSIAIADPAAQRLAMFEKLLQEGSRTLLRKAGLGRGARVLELGCGNGAMTLWLADQVGTEGQVIAVDQSSTVLAKLQERAEGAGVSNIVCRQLDLDQSVPDFDSLGADLVHGRFLLMHLKQSASILCRLFDAMCDGAMLVLEEPAITVYRSAEDRNLWRFCVNLYRRYCLMKHIDPDYGGRLVNHVSQAGFSIKEHALHAATMPELEALRYMTLSLRASGHRYVDADLIGQQALDAHITQLEARTPNDARVTHFHMVSQLIARR